MTDPLDESISCFLIRVNPWVLVPTLPNEPFRSPHFFWWTLYPRCIFSSNFFFISGAFFGHRRRSATIPTGNPTVWIANLHVPKTTFPFGVPHALSLTSQTAPTHHCSLTRDNAFAGVLPAPAMCLPRTPTPAVWGHSDLI